MTGKTFDHGVLCSSPNSVVADEAVNEEVRREFQARGGYFMNQAEMDALARGLVTPQRLPNPALVGKSATFIASQVGISVPESTRALIARLLGWARHPSPLKTGSHPLLVRRKRLAGGLRALHSDSPVWRHGPHHVDPLQERGRHPPIRAPEACVPDLREHADDAWVDWPDDRP